MTATAPRFSPAEPVYRTTEPELTGLVERADWNPLAERWDYVVVFAGRKVRAQESMLRSAAVRTDLDAWDMLADRQARGRSHLVELLTLHRLRRPPARITESYVTARTEFYPHQFKPLLKFLDNPEKRLLIGDDVGLGKTIEAGYILLELEAQQPLEHVVILVPARLTTKWRGELERRFGKHFEIVARKQVVATLERMGKGRAGDGFRWIASYETMRAPEVRALLETVQPRLDLVIADEAHRLRNPESEQHKVARELCALSDAAVFLSATPIQNRMQDLFHLLRLLSPEEFRFLDTFEHLTEANQPLVEAQSLLRRQPVPWEDVAAALERFDLTGPGRQLARSALRKDVARRVKARPDQRADLVSLQTDIGRLSPLGHIYTRTRKAEAVPDRALRQARWVPIMLTEQEARIYERVGSLYAWAGGSIGWGREMALMMVYRMTASCIPAALAYFREKREERALLALEDGDERGAEDAAQAEAELGPLVEQLLAGTPADLPDSKFSALLSALENIWALDDKESRPRQKVVIFSFFHRTVRYLGQSLRKHRVEARVMDGRMALPEREAAIEEFLTDDAVRVLVTSDVGGEGIDLQRASVLVNYDLPWNPMVVEQRIGRLDRIGQVSPRIEILNLATADSIEFVILDRLLKKINIFESTLGELDPIVGEQLDLESLARDTLLGRISREELARRVEDSAEAVMRQVTDARTMLGRVDDLMIADQAVIDEIHALLGERQIPLGRELLTFVNRALARRHAGTQFDARAADSAVTCDLRGSDLPIGMENAFPGVGDVQVFARRARNSPMQVTFSREVAYRQPRAELIHMRHPVVRYAIRILSEETGEVAAPIYTTAVASKRVPEGTYLMKVEVVELVGLRRTTRLMPLFVNVATGAVIDGEAATELLFAVCDAAGEAPVPALSAEALRQTAAIADARFAEVAHDIETRERTMDEARAEQQRARVEATLNHRLNAEEGRVARLDARENVKESVRKAAETRLRKLRDERAVLRKTPLQSHWVGVQREELACGVISVEKRGGRK
jgi:superfamily II DNA or RNA helicase